MEKKHVNNIILVLLICLGYFNLKAQSIKEVFIEAQVTDTISLTVNHWEKRELTNKIIFSNGLETLGEVNKFIFDKKLNKSESISLEQYRLIQFSHVDALNKILSKRKKMENPHSVFAKVFLVEKIHKKIIVYPVRWEKIVFKE